MAVNEALFWVGRVGWENILGGDEWGWVGVGALLDNARILKTKLVSYCIIFETDKYT